MEPTTVYSIKHAFPLDGRGIVIVPEPEIDGSCFNVGDKLVMQRLDGSQQHATIKSIEILSSRNESTWVIMIDDQSGTLKTTELSRFWISETADNKYAGMTVNERLFHSGLLDQFDHAVADRNREKMLELLSHVGMTQIQCTETADAILAK